MSLTIDWVVGVVGVVGCEPGGGDIPPKGDPVGLTTSRNPQKLSTAWHGYHVVTLLLSRLSRLSRLSHLCSAHSTGWW